LANRSDRVSVDPDYEVSQLANKHGLTQQQARGLFARVGNDREKLERRLTGRK
jgi:Protein of unknown function (DUF3606).